MLELLKEFLDEFSVKDFRLVGKTLHLDSLSSETNESLDLLNRIPLNIVANNYTTSRITKCNIKCDSMTFYVTNLTESINVIKGVKSLLKVFSSTNSDKIIKLERLSLDEFYALSARVNGNLISNQVDIDSSSLDDCVILGKGSNSNCILNSVKFNNTTIGNFTYLSINYTNYGNNSKYETLSIKDTVLVSISSHNKTPLCLTSFKFNNVKKLVIKACSSTHVDGDCLDVDVLEIKNSSFLDISSNFDILKSNKPCFYCNYLFYNEIMYSAKEFYKVFPRLVNYIGFKGANGEYC